MSTTKTRLVIDCQVLQTLAWERGMGKYSISLLGAIQEAGLPYDQVVLLFNSSLGYSEKLATVIKRLPRIHTVFISLKNPGLQGIVDIQPENISRLDSFLARSKVETDFLILALFLDQACPVFPTKSRHNLLLFYDIIPLIYHERYLTEEQRRQNYLAQYKTLFQADLIFTISQTVADDLAIYVGIPPSMMVNIDGAPVSRAHVEATRPNLPVPSKFILMPSGEDGRKNNARAIQAFDSFIERTGLDYTLVITSFFNEETRRELMEYSDKLLFAGNVSEAELVWLYRHSRLLLFASEYEGLGLPVLEAAEVSKPIACSDIPVFNEISPSAFFYFDPYDTQSISDTIELALKDQESFGRMKAEYPEILGRYSWAETARKFRAGLTQLASLPLRPTHRPRLAVLTPSPTGKNLVGRLVQELHPALSRLAEVDYYYDSPEQELVQSRPDYLRYAAPVYNAKSFNARRYPDYDAVIYHLVDSEYQLDTIVRALYLPGHVILHTTRLDSLFAGLERAGLMSASRVEAERRLQQLLGATSSNYIASVVNGALSVAVHTEAAKVSIGEVNRSSGECEVLSLPVATPVLGKRSFGQKRRLAVGLFNLSSSRKQNELYDALAALPDSEGLQLEVIEAEFMAGSSGDTFRMWSGLSDFERQQKIGKLDILVDCSERAIGLMPLTVLEAMRYGVACVVPGGKNWAAKLPDEAVLKVTGLDKRVEAVDRLVHDHDLRNALGNAGRAYTRATSSHEQYTAALLGLVLKPSASRRLAAANDINKRFGRQLKREKG